MVFPILIVPLVALIGRGITWMGFLSFFKGQTIEADDCLAMMDGFYRRQVKATDSKDGVLTANEFRHFFKCAAEFDTNDPETSPLAAKALSALEYAPRATHRDRKKCVLCQLLVLDLFSSPCDKLNKNELQASFFSWLCALHGLDMQLQARMQQGAIRRMSMNLLRLHARVDVLRQASRTTFGLGLIWYSSLSMLRVMVMDECHEQSSERTLKATLRRQIITWIKWMDSNQKERILILMALLLCPSGTSFSIFVQKMIQMTPPRRRRQQKHWLPLNMHKTRAQQGVHKNRKKLRFVYRNISFAGRCVVFVGMRLFLGSASHVSSCISGRFRLQISGPVLLPCLIKSIQPLLMMAAFLARNSDFIFKATLRKQMREL